LSNKEDANSVSTPTVSVPSDEDPFKKYQRMWRKHESRLPVKKLGSVVDALIRVETAYVDQWNTKALIDGCIQKFLAMVADSNPTAVESSSDQDDVGRIVDTWLHVRSLSAGRVDDESIGDACIEGLVTVLDKNSEYLNKASFQELKGPAEFGSIGIEFEVKSVPLVVVSPIENSPASRTDLIQGDIITEIDGTELAGLSAKAALNRLRGMPGSTVRLKVVRPGQPGFLRYTLVREIVRVDSVKRKMLASGYIYFRVDRFYEDTVSRLAESIVVAYATNDGKPQGLILDLRNNTGGLLHTGVGVAATFLPSGVLVASTEGRNRESTMRLQAIREFYTRGGINDPLEKLPLDVKRIPMVVLVGPSTASGAEMVAAALQDHGRATIMGKHTSGFGLIHTVFPFGDGTALKLATARFRRFNGETLERGVEPDIALPSVDDTRLIPISRISEDLAIQKALDHLAIGEK
jgi:carboxyl-terminal processing protease